MLEQCYNENYELDYLQMELNFLTTLLRYFLYPNDTLSSMSHVASKKLFSSS